MTINTRISNRVGGQRDASLILSAVAGYADTIFRDNVSGTNASQTYTGTNRTRINSAGTQETVAANTPVIDHVGASLIPALRVEPAAANLIFSTRTFTSTWFLQNSCTAVKDQIGVDGVANSATTLADPDATKVSQVTDGGKSKSASDSTTYFNLSVFFKKTSVATSFPALRLTYFGTVTRTVAYTLNTNTGVATQEVTSSAANMGSVVENKGLWWRLIVSATDNGANTSVHSTILPAVNTDGSGTWANATQGSCVIDAAMLTTGAIPSSYFDGAAAIGSELISAQVDRDFSGASGWANVDINAYDETGDLTITASASGQYCQLPEANAPMTAGKVYRIQFTVANYVGGWTIGDFDGNTIGTVGANGTYYMYWICTNTGGGLRITSTAVNSSGDFDNFSIKEHGTVRLSEANTVTLAMPAAVTAMLAAGTGTIVIKGRFAFARAAGVVTNILASAAATNSLVYTTTAAGNITSNDGTTIAENTGAYTANTDWKIALKFPSDTDKYRIGIDVAGAGIVWGTEVAFDGDFTTGANLILGYVLHGTTWIKYVKFFDKVLTDAQINAM